jgi:hypothetical protein
MKICFIILAHHQPKIFHKLIKQLCWENSDIIVHIDRRSNFEEFVVTGHDNVYFMNNRKSVYWGGWSLTRTICECLEYGLEDLKACFVDARHGEQKAYKLKINRFLAGCIDKLERTLNKYLLPREINWISYFSDNSPHYKVARHYIK